MHLSTWFALQHVLHPQNNTQYRAVSLCAGLYGRLLLLRLLVAVLGLHLLVEGDPDAHRALEALAHFVQRHHVALHGSAECQQIGQTLRAFGSGSEDLCGPAAAPGEGPTRQHHAVPPR